MSVLQTRFMALLATLFVLLPMTFASASESVATPQYLGIELRVGEGPVLLVAAPDSGPVRYIDGERRFSILWKGVPEGVRVELRELLGRDGEHSSLKEGALLDEACGSLGDELFLGVDSTRVGAKLMRFGDSVAEVLGVENVCQERGSRILYEGSCWVSCGGLYLQAAGLQTPNCSCCSHLGR